MRDTHALGDPRLHEATGLNRENADKWKSVISTPLRREWCRRYLRWLGPQRLSAMGYEPDRLLDELAALPARDGNLGADVCDALSSLTRAAVKARLGRDRDTPAAWRAVLGA
jgi:hypothetical protein